MDLNEERIGELSRHSSSPTNPPSPAQVRALLLGDTSHGAPLPPMPELTAALTSVARGLRKKVLLPLAGAPAELALVRQGEQLLISHYETGASPNVLVLHRRVELAKALLVCGRATAELAEKEGDPACQQIAAYIAGQALQPGVIAAPTDDARPIARSGGRSTRPPRGVALAFGFRARIPPGESALDRTADRADMHALLFDGELWAFLNGRRSAILKGPILLAVQRMVGAIGSLVDAWDAGRPLGLRVAVGGFQVGMRIDNRGVCELSLGGDGVEPVSATDLPLVAVARPILRLGSDLCRALISVDRSQNHNLRVRDLRDRIGGLRRLIRQRERADSFINADTDRMLFALRESPRSAAEPAEAPPVSLRYAERWRVGLDGLDIGSAFLSRDRLIVDAGRQTIALSRETGDVLWVKDASGTSSWLAGDTLLRVGSEGELELCRVSDGEPYATSHIRPPVGGRLHGMLLRARNLPPLVVLREGQGELVGIDLRTAEARWRFNLPVPAHNREGDRLCLWRSGRVLVATCTDGSVNAIDMLNGDVLWRYRDRTRFELAPAVLPDVVIALAGSSRAARSTVYGIDLLSGQLRWKRSLTAPCTGSPIATASGAILPLDRVAPKLTMIDSDGKELWHRSDPGLRADGGAIALDDALIINGSNGAITAVGLQDGTTIWSRQLSDPNFDEHPQVLQPSLRSGALFAPSAVVHVLRPTDGSILSELPCDLVPDLLRVDERGWVFVADACGYLAAYAPAPNLRLVHGGR